MDSCFALFKTLFRSGSPYSYDLGDLARYYLAYHQLMEHWRRVLPGRIPGPRLRAPGAIAGERHA